jgi:hypothetical protein
VQKIYTAMSDGLTLPWFGLVFCNPPYGGRFGHVPWLEKFLDHGDGVGVFRAYTSSSWWHDHMTRAQMICFPRGKTKFVRPDGSIGMAPGHGTAIIAMGDVACAALQHSGLGMIWDQRNMTRAEQALIDIAREVHLIGTIAEMLKQYHPDAVAGLIAEKFAEIAGTAPIARDSLASEGEVNRAH